MPAQLINITLATEMGPRTIEKRAHVYGRFAVFKDIDTTWNVTHLPSGMRVASRPHFPTAIRIARLLDAQGDQWGIDLARALKLKRTTKWSVALKASYTAAVREAEKENTHANS